MRAQIPNPWLGPPLAPLWPPVGNILIGFGYFCSFFLIFLRGSFPSFFLQKPPKYPRKLSRGRPKQCVCFVLCFVFVGFGDPGGGFGAPEGSLEQVEAVALPLLVPMLKKLPPGAPPPPTGQPKQMTKKQNKTNEKTKKTLCRSNADASFPGACYDPMPKPISS